MADFKNVMSIKLVVAIIIFVLLMSVKSVIFSNIENLGFTPFQQNSFLTSWESFKGDYMFILVSIALSLLIGLKFNIKLE